MIRDLGGGLQLDDDKDRVDLAEVHRFLSEEAYWAKGRPRETVERLVREASRVVGLVQRQRRIAEGLADPLADLSFVDRAIAADPPRRTSDAMRELDRILSPTPAVPDEDLVEPTGGYMSGQVIRSRSYG